MGHMCHRAASRRRPRAGATHGRTRSAWPLAAIVALLLLFTARVEAAPYLVKHINPGICGSYPCSSYPNALTRAGDSIFFSASDPGAGAELWRTDGTDAGTTRVADINPGPASANPGQVIDAN